MKVAHLNKKVAYLNNAIQNKALQGTLREQLEAGRSLETDKKYDEAIRLYAGILKKKPLTESVYNRLMILYRKKKDYKSELKIVDTAIAAFEEHNASGAKKHISAVERLSRSIGKSTGLLNKKGKSVYEPEPIATWKKRKLMIKKRMEKG